MNIRGFRKKINEYMTIRTTTKCVLIETNKAFVMENSWYPDLWSNTMWAKVAGYKDILKVGEIGCDLSNKCLIEATALGSIYDFHCNVVWKELCG